MSTTSPSLPPRAVVARLFRLFGQGRLEETFELMHADVELNEPGDPSRLPWAGQFRGHEGLQRFYDGLATGLARVEIDPDSLRLTRLDDERVLALGTERGISAETGKAYASHSAWIWTVRDGLISHLVAFHDTAAMQDAMTA